MDETHDYDERFEATLGAFAYYCMLHEAESLRSMDISGIEDDPKFKARVMRRVKWQMGRPKRIAAAKIAIVACLAVLSLLFTACMCVPEVREAIWNVAVEWYDDHIAITFRPVGADTDTTASAGGQGAPLTDANGTGNGTSDQTNPDAAPPVDPLQPTPPTTIEQKAVPTYLPEGYYMEEAMSSSLAEHNYVYSADGILKFMIIQSTIAEANVKVDNENDPITKLYINQNIAILVEYPDTPGMYSLIWQDESYAYTLQGEFSSIYEIRKIAESMQLQK